MCSNRFTKLDVDCFHFCTKIQVQINTINDGFFFHLLVGNINTFYHLIIQLLPLTTSIYRYSNSLKARYFAIETECRRGFVNWETCVVPLGLLLASWLDNMDYCSSFLVRLERKLLEIRRTVSFRIFHTRTNDHKEIFLQNKETSKVV